MVLRLFLRLKIFQINQKADNYYKCFTKKKNKSKCDKKSIPQQYIEDIVLQATQNFLQSANLKAIAKETINSYNKFIEKDLQRIARE